MLLKCRSQGGQQSYPLSGKSVRRATSWDGSILGEPRLPDQGIGLSRVHHSPLAQGVACQTAQATVPVCQPFHHQPSPVTGWSRFMPRGKSRCCEFPILWLIGLPRVAWLRWWHALVSSPALWTLGLSDVSFNIASCVSPLIFSSSIQAVNYHKQVLVV